MKFAECEREARKAKSGQTQTVVRSLEMFEPYVEDLESHTDREKVYTFNQYSVILRGIPEDFKVFFSSFDLHNQVVRHFVGERVHGADYNLHIPTYDEMMQAFKDNNITF